MTFWNSFAIRRNNSDRFLPPNATAPNHPVETLEGKTLDLAELWSSGPRLLIFIKSSCPTCQYSGPFWKRLRLLDTENKLPITLVSQSGTDATRAFVDSRAEGLDVVLDRSESGYLASNAFGITHVPTAFLIGQQGVVESSWTGFSKADLVEVATRIGVTLFGESERVPDFRPG